MQPQVLYDFIIKPTLETMGSKYDSLAARQLLLATSAQESHCGYYGKQIKGPALGLYQHEPRTLNDLYLNYLNDRPDKLSLVEGFNILSVSDKLEIVGNNFYATALARMHYYRDSEPIPEFDDFYDMWLFYKRVWNSDLGTATRREFLTNWSKYVDLVEF